MYCLFSSLKSGISINLNFIQGRLIVREGDGISFCFCRQKFRYQLEHCQCVESSF